MNRSPVYELRMIIANTAVAFILWVAPKERAGIRLIVALGKHYEGENQLPDALR